MEQNSLYQNENLNMPHKDEKDFDHYVTVQIHIAVNKNVNPFQ